ncbi:hypothetical protein [Lentzea atacamensis]|uniref:hypothetical protein n=1 Tax=Lentzea atacamensis TaxID=531938 RepID=UPI0011BD870F|nr:hypothetical protein [Lentzea atacamensis]
MWKTVIAGLLVVTSAPVASAAPEQVPHVVASHYLGLGDGIGFEQAKAHLCELAGMGGELAADPQFRDRGHHAEAGAGEQEHRRREVPRHHAVHAR